MYCFPYKSSSLCIVKIKKNHNTILFTTYFKYQLQQYNYDNIFQCMFDITKCIMFFNIDFFRKCDVDANCEKRNHMYFYVIIYYERKK